VQESRRAETGSDRGAGSRASSGSRASPGSTGRSCDKVRKVSIVTKREPAEHRSSAGFFTEGSDCCGVLATVSHTEKIWTTEVRRFMGRHII
jgi:hypothetical protein